MKSVQPFLRYWVLKWKHLGFSIYRSYLGYILPFFGSYILFAELFGTQAGTDTAYFFSSSETVFPVILGKNTELLNSVIRGRFLCKIVLSSYIMLTHLKCNWSTMLTQIVIRAPRGCSHSLSALCVIKLVIISLVFFAQRFQWT